MKATVTKYISILFVLSTFLSVVFVSSVLAVANVDENYFPVISKPLNADVQTGQLVQPDGKVVIWSADYSGTSYAIDGQGKGMIARLNVDGTVDNAFSFCRCLPTIFGVGMQADGKFIVAGVGSNGQSRVVRINSDGSQDPGFNAAFSGFLGSNADFYGFAPDGKIYVTHYGSLGSGWHAGYLLRLNTDGTQDTSFAVIYFDSGRLIWGYLRSIAVLPSGKLYFASTSFSGGSPSAYLRRFNADGTPDTTWEQPSMASFQTDIQTLALQPDEALLVGGSFSTMNGVSRPNFIRLLPAGNVDLGFIPTSTMPVVQQIRPLASGKILYSSGGRLTRLNPDGSVDNSFVFPTTIAAIQRKWSISSTEQTVFYASVPDGSYRFFRLNVDGDIDASFNPNVSIFGQAYALAVQTDDKTIVAGSFTFANSASRANIARFNADGTTDTTFDPGTGFNQVPSRIVVQPDGKILVAGPFATFNGVPVSGLVRLNSNGSLDASFTTVVTSVVGTELESDGKILVFGSFTLVNGVAKQRLARLSPDGSLDSTFTSQIASGSVYSATRETDGKYIVGGSFSGVDGFNRSNLVRLNTNGSIDLNFNASGVSTINEVKPVAGGKYVCITGAGAPSGLLRRNSDGSADATFKNNTFLGNSDPRLYAMLVQPDGTLIVGGNFYSINGVSRGNIARLDVNGNLDTLFFPTGANTAVNALARQANGNVIVGGQFTSFNNFTRSGVARVTPGALVRVTPFDFDGDGRADVSVFRASEGRWYILRSSDLTISLTNFAMAGDIPTPADFDGDGKTDIAIYRPSNGDWWSISSLNGQQINGSFGQTNGIPLPSDITGDGRADYVIYRSATGYWSRVRSDNGQGMDRNFGAVGDKPLIADFNGDGMTDPAIYRPSDGNWWWLSSADGVQRATRWGIAEDIPVSGDFDSDGKTDFSVFRPSTGVWYIYNSSNGSSTIFPFGLSGDKPVAADYDGDGRYDVSVYRPSDGIWYLLRSTSGFWGVRWGISTDVPTPNAFVP